MVAFLVFVRLMYLVDFLVARLVALGVALRVVAPARVVVVGVAAPFWCCCYARVDVAVNAAIVDVAAFVVGMGVASSVSAPPRAFATPDAESV